MRLQLRPHFLFNALHTINLLWRTGRGEQAQETLERLSGLLRRFLDESIPDEIRLRRELAMARDYLDIERVRFGDRLDVKLSVEESTLDALVPSFVLQPIIENAITHGIEPDSMAGQLTILAERSGGELTLEVRDDGPGAAPAGGGCGHGIGLANVSQRLRALYGSDGRVEVAALPERGTSVRVHLPYRIPSRPPDDREGGGGGPI